MSQKIRTLLSQRHLGYTVLLASSLLAIWWLRSPVSQFLDWISSREAVTASIQQYGPLGMLVLGLLLVLQVFLGVIPGHALMMAGGYVYGFTPGFLITLSSTVLGSQLAFFIARRFGRKIVHRLAHPDHIRRWDRFAEYQGFLFYFFALVLPIFPNDMMCYIAGLGRITPTRFLAANLLGRLVTAVFITWIGSNGMHMPVVFWISAVLGLAALYAVWRLYRRRCLFSNRRDDHENRIPFSILSAHDKRGGDHCPTAG